MHIMTQKYNSACDIDTEFIPSLEALLSNCIPSFEFIKSFEKNSAPNVHFTYYLFFGNKTNAPIGFAQLEITKGQAIKKSLLSSIFKKELLAVKNEHEIKWSIPGSSNEGVIFEPLYVKYAAPKIKKIYNEFFSREDIYSQNLILSEAYSQVNQMLDNAKSTPLNAPETLVKNCSSYEEFLSKLPDEIQDQIKSDWKKIYKDYSLKMGDFSSFKEAFEYKSKGSKQRKELRSIQSIQKYIKLEENINFLTLESNDELKAFIFFVHGNGINCFYDIFVLDEKITEEIAHQVAILKFYESSKSNRLYYLGETSKLEDLCALGFTKRNQLLIKASKKRD